MTQTIALQINNQFAGPLKKGYPLILKDAVDTRKLPSEEGALLRLLDIHNRFIGTGYYGIQNKGIGWLLTTDADEEIDKTFFAKKLKKPFKIVNYSLTILIRLLFVSLMAKVMASVV